jgi:hypothetical protein
MSAKPSIIQPPKLPSYMRPLYSFPETKEAYYNVPGLQVERPFNSPPKNYNIKTSYANSFSPNISKDKIKNTAMKIVGNTSIYSDIQASSPMKTRRKTKSLSKVVDVVTGDSAIYGKKIVTPSINSPIGFKPDNFEAVILKVNSPYVSEGNNCWIKEQEKRKIADKFNQGEYIPSISQMQVYGRKEPKSKFDIHELWKPNLIL